MSFPPNSKEDEESEDVPTLVEIPAESSTTTEDSYQKQEDTTTSETLRREEINGVILEDVDDSDLDGF